MLTYHRFYILTVISGAIMSQVVIPLSSTDSTIIRPVVKSVLEQLMHLLSMSVDDIVYEERGGKSKTYSSFVDGAPLQLASKDYIIVKRTVTPSDSLMDTSYRDLTNRRIFSAPKLGIFITPILENTNIELSITFRTSSLDKLRIWKSRLRQQLLLKSASYNHNVEYNYTIPTPIVAYLANVHNALQPPSISVDAFLQKYFTNGIGLRDNTRLILRVNQAGVTGLLQGIPDNINTNKEDNFSEVEFTYKVLIDTPTMLRLDFQSFVHNSLVDTKMLTGYATPVYTANPITGNRDMGGAVHTILKQDIPNTLGRDAFMFPEDTWAPKKDIPGYITILSTPIMIDSVSPLTVLNLSELVNLRFTAEMLSIINTYSLDITTPYASPWLVEVWSVDDIDRSMPITMSSSNDVLLNITPNLTCRHYLRILLLTDISRMNYTNWLNSVNFLFTVLGYSIINLKLASITTVNRRNANPYGDGTTLHYLGNNSRIVEDSLINVIRKSPYTNGGYVNYYHRHIEFIDNRSTIITKRI